MKTSNTVTLTDSAALTHCERTNLPLALVRANAAEKANLEDMILVLARARSEETWQRTRFMKSCDNTELPYHSVVSDWAHALKAREEAEDKLTYLVGRIHFWWAA